MKRRRRYGEKYSGLPYPEDFKARMLRAFCGGDDLKEALDGGWESVGRWFNELSYGSSAISVKGILDYLREGERGISRLKEYCEIVIEREAEFKSLHDEWERIVFLDNQNCKPWSD